MNKHTRLTLHIVSFLFCTVLTAQNNISVRSCYTQELFEQQLKEQPERAQIRENIERRTQEFYIENNLQTRTIISIPVVVHVLFSNNTENIPDAQIQSQIDVLNEDFRKQNIEIPLSSSQFAASAADVGIQFCLAKTDKNGQNFSGVNRVYVNRSSWGTSSDIKFKNAGGVDAWDATKYLNLWVGNLGGSTIGYSQYPGGPINTDGVVIDYRYFGRLNTRAPFDKGRTATHEIGHWLNLVHIWGDKQCGNDFVDDTPQHHAANYGCPAMPSRNNTCSAGNIEMTMNFMDYVNDACMYMFSEGQKARMLAQFQPGMPRAVFLNATACNIPAVQNSCTDNYEPNNVRFNAADITGKSEIIGKISSKTDRDWYTFKPGNTSQNQILLTNLPFDYDLKLYDSNGHFVKSSENMGRSDESIYFTPNSVNDVYFVQVYGYNGNFDDNSCYKLKIKTKENIFFPVLADNIQSKSFIQNEISKGVKVFPNPATDNFILELSPEKEETLQITLYDLTGKIWLQQTSEVSKTNNRLLINTHKLPTGIYIINVSQKELSSFEKIIINR